MWDSGLTGLNGWVVSVGDVIGWEKRGNYVHSVIRIVIAINLRVMDLGMFGLSLGSLVPWEVV